MAKRLIIWSCAAGLALALSGCSKCGFWWDEWQSAPRSCKSDIPK